MHDSFLFTPAEDALPPNEVRFSELRVEQWPDGQRVRIHVDITPFQQRPDLEVTILDSNGREIASTLIVETLENRMVFTMHLFPDSPGQELSLIAVLSYRDIGPMDERKVSFITHPVDPRTN
ncbi:MAG TPA: hypothetical protein VKF38_11820 [Anaerolineaceae bacterium]|nr:hypothetical protein [Anaerolineaceae bacterium]